MCTATNLAASKASTKYILYSHDDMYFCPEWDVYLMNEINKINTKLFYFSGTMLGPRGHINIDCGETYKDFNEKKLLQNYNKNEFYDHQGSHWAPHLIHKDFFYLIRVSTFLKA